MNTDDDYEDHDEENMFPAAEDPHTTEKRFRCDHCGKKRLERSNTLFPPFCCGRTMKFEHIVEKKFDFASIAKRTIEKERAMYGKPAKQKPRKRAKPAKKKSKSKAKKPKATSAKGKKKGKKR